MYADALNTNTPSGKEKKDHRCADMYVDSEEENEKEDKNEDEKELEL